MSAVRTACRRVCPGLYVDPAERWVISREGRSYYSIRRFRRWHVGPTGSAFPIYSGVWMDVAYSLNEAKSMVYHLNNEEAR